MMDFLDAPNLMQAEGGGSRALAPALSMGRPLVSTNSGVDLSSLRYDLINFDLYSSSKSTHKIKLSMLKLILVISNTII